MGYKSQSGTAMNISWTPAKKKSLARNRRREEKRWKELCGPVVCYNTKERTNGNS